MILRRITEHVKAQNWFAVAIDFLIADKNYKRPTRSTRKVGEPAIREQFGTDVHASAARSVKYPEILRRAVWPKLVTASRFAP